MRKLLNISVLFISITSCSQFLWTQNNKDTTTECISIYAKAGLGIYYPYFYNSVIVNHYQKFCPTQEIGLNISTHRVQAGIGIGYYPLYYNDQPIRVHHSLYIPCSAGIQVFNLKRNILSVNGSIIFVVPFLYTTSSDSKNLIGGFGIATSFGIKYSRLLGRRFLITAETTIAFNLVSIPSSYGLTYFYGNTLQIGIEYFFGKKCPMYLTESRHKRKY